MAYLGKEYKIQKQENVDGFLKASVDLPEDQIAKMLEFKHTSKLVKNGDTYTYISNSPEGGTKEISFKSGVEFQTVRDKIPIKNTYIVDGNTVTQNMSTEEGTAKYVREYNGDEMVLSMTSPKFDGVAKAWYKAV